MAHLVLKDLVKNYEEADGENVCAVNGIHLEVKPREFMVLVGPSGCGKSTTLRMVAGLEEISGGTIEMDGREINLVEPKDRDMAMVFQNFALYPHMSVYDNMAFGLKLRKLPKEKIRERVMQAASILDLTDILHRKPKHLSGGEQQRVAVGRAIVRNAKLFLFDEPLSNLDAKMRVFMRTEISKLHTRLATTIIYVTHDQAEAMTMGDRICVMNKGKIEQIDEPLTVYNYPKNLFVAGFIGSPTMNFLYGHLEANENGVLFIEKNTQAEPIRFSLGDQLSRRAADYIGKEIIVGIRAESVGDVLTLTNPKPEHSITATIELTEPMGLETYLYLTTGEHSIIARVDNKMTYQVNQPIKVCLNMEQTHIFDPVTEKVID